jgi:hypothetical protein
MARTLPIVVTFVLATSAAWAQDGRLNAAGPDLAVPGKPLSGPPLIGGAAAGITPGATPPTGNTALGGGMAPGATPPLDSAAPGARAQPVRPGANSFTMGQAAARMHKQGFTNVTGLHKDEQGVWHGKAMRNGRPASVSLDYRGAVVGGQDSATGRDAGQTNPGETR